MTVRVLHVIDGLGVSGGAERQLALNLRFLDREKIENHVAHVWPKVQLVPEIEAMGIPVYSLGLTKKHQWIVGVWRLVKLIRKHRIDVVHTSLFQSEMIGGVAARITGRPVLGTLVNQSYGPEWLVDNPELNRSKLRLVKFVRSAVLRTCYRHMMAITDAAKSSAEENLNIPARKISVIRRSLGPQWTSDELVTPGQKQSDAIRNKLGVSDASPLLISVGRLTPQKGQRYLLEAMSDLRQKFPNIKLLIVGEKTIETELKALRKQLNLDGHVEFLGVRNDVKELLSAADICVSPSLFEGFGNAVIEAAAVAKPLVVTRIPPYQELLVENTSTLMVDIKSSAQLVEAITELVDKPERASRMGAAAREHVTSRYGVESTVSRLAVLYEELHTGRRPMPEFDGTN